MAAPTPTPAPQSAEDILGVSGSAESILLRPSTPPQASAESILLPKQSAVQEISQEGQRLVTLPFRALRDEYWEGIQQADRGWQGLGARVTGQSTATLSDLVTGKTEQPTTLGSLADIALGYLRAAGAPVTAGARTLLDPATRITQAATGMSEPTRQFVQDFTEPLVGLGLSYGGGKVIGQYAHSILRGGKPTPTGTPVPVPRSATVPEPIVPTPAPTIAEPFAVAGPRVPVESMAKVANAADDAVRGRLDNSQRLFRHVADSLEAGEISAESVPGILSKYGLTPTQFAQHYAKTVSESGRTLQQLSELRKRLGKVFESEPDALKALGGLKDQPASTGMTLTDMYRKVDNVRRPLLVTQWSTAIRNAVTQAGRYTVDAADTALTGVIGGQPWRAALRDGAENFSAVARRMTVKGRDDLGRILDEFPVEAERLTGTIAGEATLGSKVANFLNPFNRAQEGFVRSIAFDSKLRLIARAHDKDLASIAARDIPPQWIEQATQHALEISFSKTPQSGFGKALLDAYKAVPFLTTINPFPRFWANSLRFLYEFSPLPMLSPQTYKTIAAGGEAGHRALSRVTIGSGMLASAMALRGSDLAGEKWYEIKVPGTDKRLDMRPFGPFSFYLLAAEGMLRPENVGMDDWAKGLVGINRVAGTGLVLLDALEHGTVEQKLDKFYAFVGQYFGGFGVPLRNFKAAIEGAGSEGVAREEGKLRDIRDNPVLAPFFSNVPGLSQDLPEMKRPTRAETPTREYPLFRQLTGLNVNSKTLVEQEVDRLGLPPSALLPASGIAPWDRAVAERMGPRVESRVPMLIASEMYDKAPKPVRRYILRSVFAELRKEAVNEARRAEPEIATQAALKGLDSDLRELLGIGPKGLAR